MPGYIFHLYEGKCILDKMSKAVSDEWKNLFLLGCLLPDAVSLNGKILSHFQDEADQNQIFILPHPERFIEKYGLSYDNPTSLGYYAHLHLDLYFITHILSQSACFLDKDGAETNIWNQVYDIVIKQSGEHISRDEFFTETYLYGDYTRLNQFLIDKYQLLIPHYVQSDYSGIEEIDFSSLSDVLKELNCYIQQSDEDKEKTELKLRILHYEILIGEIGVCVDGFFSKLNCLVDVSK